MAHSKKKIKVAVIAPPYPLEEEPAPPLGVTYVAAAFASAGAEVRIFDYIVSRYTPEKMTGQLEDFKPDVVGITSVTMNFPVAAEIISTAKRHRPSVITIMGGPHVSFTASETLQRYPGIDLVVRGEGERTIAELMGAGMERQAWKSIRGLSFRDEGRIFETDPQPFIEDLDTLPLPARDLLPLSRYQALGFPISIITSRGCPYSCIFCLGRRMVGRKVRSRSPSLVVDEIEQILSYGIDRINFADDLFVSDRGKVRDVCEEILKRGIKFTWSAFARVNTVDKETLALMRRAGCDSVSFGVESGDPEILKTIRKGITLAEVRRAVALCRELGIIAHTSFIAGLPGETKESLQQTEGFASSLGSLYGYHFLTPFPGTTVREEIERYDLKILTDDWSRYDANSAIVRTAALAPKDIEDFVAAFENRINQVWEDMLRRYREGRQDPQLTMQIEGQLRTRLVYKILSEDLIEKAGTFSLSQDGTGRSLKRLVSRLAAATGMDRDLVEKTVNYFNICGFIKEERTGGKVRWYWTHNRLRDKCPLS